MTHPARRPGHPPRRIVQRAANADAEGGADLVNVGGQKTLLASVAIAHFLKNTQGKKDIRMKDVYQLLKAYTVCSLRVKDNRIYAITHDARTMR